MKALIGALPYERNKVDVSNFGGLVESSVEKDGGVLERYCESWDSKCSDSFVRYGEFSNPSNGISFSERYYDCCALSLLGNGFGMLSHYDVSVDLPTECDVPEIYVNRMVDSMLERMSSDEIIAVPIGGIKSHFDRISEILDSRGVRIGNYYFDNYCGKNLSDSEKGFVALRKTVLINPSEESVFVKADFVSHPARVFEFSNREK
jgi:hypothetical protein